MAKPRPTEIKLVAKLLDPDNQNSEDASELAIEIIEALDKSRVKRDAYILVARLADWAPYQAWGEFSTRLQAERFVQHLCSADKGAKGKAVIINMENPDELTKRIGVK